MSATNHPPPDPHDDERERREADRTCDALDGNESIDAEIAALGRELREALTSTPRHAPSRGLRLVVDMRLDQTSDRKDEAMATGEVTPNKLSLDKSHEVEKGRWQSVVVYLIGGVLSVGLLVSLLLPATQMARESSRRISRVLPPPPPKTASTPVPAGDMASSTEGIRATPKATHPFPEPNESLVDGGRLAKFLEVEAIRAQTGPSPNWSVAPNTEEYALIADNGYRAVREHPLSTFSIDVDTASYANVRRFITSGTLPPRDAVRIEEFVNYFHYDYPQPQGNQPFSVKMETAQCPWNSAHTLLQVGLKGKDIARQSRSPSNLVFLIDVSGSMASDDKLPLVQSSLRQLVQELGESDSVSLVTYAGESALRLPATNGTDKRKILAAIDSLSSGGSTHGSAGIRTAYEQARKGFIQGGTNRVLLCTDGDLNVGVTSDEALVELIEQERKSGVFLTVLGFGTGNLKDSKMEKIADHGNGIYAYIDGIREGRKVLVEQMSGSLVTIAKDVKIQIEFNPRKIREYRLVGYENRVLANKDFNDDKKDAGEIGAGHTVTALYELIPADAVAARPEVDPLKYQAEKKDEPGIAKLPEVDVNRELLTLKLRYKEPAEETSKLLEYPYTSASGSFAQASSDFRFAAAVAAFGMQLRQSEYRGDLQYDGILEIAASSLGADAGGYRAEFVDLVRRSKMLAMR